jgi:hypothetical protein
MHALIQSLDGIFGKKAPQLPASVKAFIVKVAPYVIVIGLIFTVVSLFALIPLMLGIATLAAYGAYGSTTSVAIALVFALITGILEVMALPGLFKKTAHGWNMVFYAQLVSLLGLLLSLNIIGLIISAVIGFYILFQIRSYYMGGASMDSTPAPTPTPTPTSTPTTPAQM